MHEKVSRQVDVFDWTSGMKFGHLLLPCATAEVSSEGGKGVTRLCFPFIQASRAVDVEGAIASLCGLTWFLAFILEQDLVASGRLCRVLHKMRIRKEDGDLWFNKGCQSDRIATAIKDGRKSVLYMYVGGGAVDHEQSYLLGGLVVLCKNWRWAALAYAAARVVGLASNNSLGSLNSALVTPYDNEDPDSTSSALPPDFGFRLFCENIWQRASSSCCDLLDDLEKQRRSDRSARSTQSENVGHQLASLKSENYEAVMSLLSESV